MKNILIAILFIFTGLTMNSQSLIWSDPIEVASGYGNLRPRLALANGDLPIVVWGGGSGNQPVYVSKFNGTGFNTPIAISPEGVDPYCASWVGPDIASTGTDVWVVFEGQVGSDFRIYSAKSNDGGATFGDTVNVGGYSGLTRFSAIGVDDAGSPVVTFMEHDQGYANPRYVVSNTKDGGNSWEEYVDASHAITSSEVCDCCPAEVITDGDNQILMFRNNDSNLRDMWASVSADKGETFTTGSDIDDAGWIISACPSTGPDGFVRGDSVIVTWMTGGYGSPPRVMLNSVSKFTGIGRANQTIDTEGSAKQNYPRVHGNDQVFAVVYQKPINGSQECILAYSTDGTTQFQKTGIIINLETSGSQTNPDVVFANNVFHFTWQDDKSGNVIYRTATLNQVGIKDTKDFDIRIYPNPAQNKLYINIPEHENIDEVVIYSNSGRSIKKSVLRADANLAEIDISDLMNGFYSVSIKTEKGNYAKTFIKID